MLQCPQCDTPLSSSEHECSCGFRYQPPREMRLVQHELPLDEVPRTMLFLHSQVPRTIH